MKRYRQKKATGGSVRVNEMSFGKALKAVAKKAKAYAKYKQRLSSEPETPKRKSKPKLLELSILKD